MRFQLNGLSNLFQNAGFSIFNFRTDLKKNLVIVEIPEIPGEIGGFPVIISMTSKLGRRRARGVLLPNHKNLDKAHTKLQRILGKYSLNCTCRMGGNNLQVNIVYRSLKMQAPKIVPTGKAKS